MANEESVNKQLWSRIDDMVNVKLTTLSKKKRFSLDKITDEVVIISDLTTREIHSIPKSVLEEAHNRLSTTGHITVEEIENEYAPHLGIFVGAILGRLPGVKKGNRPNELKVYPSDYVIQNGMVSKRNDLLDYVKADGRICPNPKEWNVLWEMLPDKQQFGSSWEPPLPLILAAWLETPHFRKEARLNEHIHPIMVSLMKWMLICEG
jgi:hypothetical protein